MTLFEKYNFLEVDSDEICASHRVTNSDYGVQNLSILNDVSTIETKPKIEYPQMNVQYTKIKANSNWTLRMPICLVLYLNEPETILKLIIDTQFTDTLLSMPVMSYLACSFANFLSALRNVN